MNETARANCSRLSSKNARSWLSNTICNSCDSLPVQLRFCTRGSSWSRAASRPSRTTRVSSKSISDTATVRPKPRRNEESIMLAIEQVSTGYGESRIVSDVSLEVRDGQVVCLMGRNGVGKTTLLKAIMGLLKAKSGQIYFGDHAITGLSPSKRAQ